MVQQQVLDHYRKKFITRGKVLEEMAKAVEEKIEGDLEN